MFNLSDFDDPNYFASCAEKIKRYKTIIIDEVQDFKTEWLASIITYFLTPDGTVSVFGDGEAEYIRQEDGGRNENAFNTHFLR